MNCAYGGGVGGEGGNLARYSLFNYTRNIKFSKFKKYNIIGSYEFRIKFVELFTLRGKKS